MVLDKKVGNFVGVGKCVFPGYPVSRNIWLSHRISHRIIFRVNSGKDREILEKEENSMKNTKTMFEAMRAGAVVR
jgi:hypothetical protein